MAKNHMSGHHKATRQEQADRAAQHKRARAHHNERLGPPLRGNKQPGPFPPGSPQAMSDEAIDAERMRKIPTSDPHIKGGVWQDGGITRVSRG
jgi:hypothetical protein